MNIKNATVMCFDVERKIICIGILHHALEHKVPTICR